MNWWVYAVVWKCIGQTILSCNSTVWNETRCNMSQKRFNKRWAVLYILYSCTHISLNLWTLIFHELLKISDTIVLVLNQVWRRQSAASLSNLPEDVWTSQVEQEGLDYRPVNQSLCSGYEPTKKQANRWLGVLRMKPFLPPPHTPKINQRWDTVSPLDLFKLLNQTTAEFTTIYHLF